MAASAKLQRGLMAVLVLLLIAIAAILLSNGGAFTSAVASTTYSPFDGPSMPAGLRTTDAAFPRSALASTPPRTPSRTAAPSWPGTR